MTYLRSYITTSFMEQGSDKTPNKTAKKNCTKIFLFKKSGST